MTGGVTGGPVTVLVVDDLPDMRELIRLLLETDGRYEVVGEAVDGLDALEAARRLQPEVVVLDRSMPRMTGLEALPELRRIAPRSVVVLYTAEADQQIRQAAVAAGAVDVLEKDASVGDLAGLLAGALVRGADESMPRVQVGPVAAAAALEWIDNTARIVDAVRADPDVADVDIAPEVFDRFTHYLDTWRAVAQANDEFVWSAEAAPSEVADLLEAWASIDRLDEAALAQIGMQWSTGQGREFFTILTAGVLGALEKHEATVALADRLRPQWGAAPA